MTQTKYRTHTCGELRMENVGQTVTVAGWLENLREVGSNLGFLVLRDMHGVTQVVIETEEMMAQVKVINKESVLAVTGAVRERASKNPKLPTGDIEVVPSEIQVLGRCRHNELPFEVNYSKDAGEDARLKYRYLDLRNPQVKGNIVLRSQVVSALRRAMEDQGFLEITTPILTASSPEGARDYLVPSRKHPGKFYALPQAPFTRIPYLQAMEEFGSDKPDLRIDLRVKDVTDLLQGCGFGPFEGNLIKAVPVSGCKLTRKAIDKLCADVEVQAGQKPYWFRVDDKGEIVGGIAKFLNADPALAAQVKESLSLENDTLVLLCAGTRAQVWKTSGVMVKMAGAQCEGHMDAQRYEFCWIVDFPLYEIGEESGQLEFCHNPFSMPSGGLEVLEKAEAGEIDPLTILAEQYDLVCNGVELSSGAVRNHDPEIMVKAFELVGLGEEDVKQKFPAMYNAFCYGAPPHAGIAPGVDRMVMLLTGEASIREVIAFPMNKSAQDLMMDAPAAVSSAQLEELSIQVVEHSQEGC